MDWGKGYGAKYYITFVNPNTWGDGENLNMTGGSMNLETTGLRVSANIDCKEYDDMAYGEKLIRVWLDTRQEDFGGHTPLFTGYASAPQKNYDFSRFSTTLECYSVLKPADDILLSPGWYAPYEANGVDIIRSLLRCTKAPFSVSQDLSQPECILRQAIIAESGETNLTMVDKILDAMGKRLKINGDGSLYLDDYSTTPVQKFDSMYNDVIEPGLKVTHDWFNCPNVFRAVMDEQVAVARDEDSDTPFSIRNRGREVWYEETDCLLNQGEALQEYANRRLKEVQRVGTTVSYDRRFDPNVLPTDVVEINYPVQNINGKFMIKSQSVSFGYCASTSEEVVMI